MFVKQGIWKVAVNYFAVRSISSFVKNFIWIANDSIRRKGLKRSIIIALGFLGDFSFDLRYGTNTMSRVKLHDLEIKSSNKLSGHKYAPTKARPFKQLMNTLTFPDNSVFVDFGCGKGRILLLASQYGFKRVVGIEFSPELCEEAKKNLSIYRKQVKSVGNVQIMESDVVGYKIRDDENVFYLYSPFDGVMMTKALRNINVSLENKQRKIWLIYNNPVFHDIIESQGIFVKSKEYFFGGSDFSVYVNNYLE